MKSLTKFVIGLVTILVISNHAAAQLQPSSDIQQRMYNHFKAVQDYYINMSIGDKAFTEFATGAFGGGAALIASNVAKQAGKTVLSRIALGASVLGYLLVVDGVVYQYSKGKISVLNNIFLPKPASAATLSDYYQSTPEAFESFLKLEPENASLLMLNSESLALVVSELAKHIQGLPR